MTTTTLNPKLNLLENMSAALTSPRIKSPVLHVAAGRRPAGIRVVVPSRREPLVRPRSSLGRRLDGIAESMREHLLRGTLILAAVGGLTWLAFLTLQFFLAWQGLVSGLRLALA